MALVKSLKGNEAVMWDLISAGFNGDLAKLASSLY